MRLGAWLITGALLTAPCETTSAEPANGLKQFPAELQGTWDEYPTPCKVAGVVDSDARISIESAALRGYENNDALRSIEKLSAAPPTWRVVTISDVAPAEIQGEADIYVLRGDTLTITNGERSYTHVRCK
jgi:hypothetical protein